jgi:hypothetical protein
MPGHTQYIIILTAIIIEVGVVSNSKGGGFGVLERGWDRALACVGSNQVCLPSVQVKAAAAHVRRLKRNQRR